MRLKGSLPVASKSCEILWSLERGHSLGCSLNATICNLTSCNGGQSARTSWTGVEEGSGMRMNIVFPHLPYFRLDAVEAISILASPRGLILPYPSHIQATFLRKPDAMGS